MRVAPSQLTKGRCVRTSQRGDETDGGCEFIADASTDGLQGRNGVTKQMEDASVTASEGVESVHVAAE
jgi:hypothetical protein